MRLFDQYKNLRRENYVLFFGRVVTNLGAMVWPMLTLIMNQKMGMSASTVAVVMVLAGVVLLPVSILGGRLADRCNKKMLIVVCDTISVVFYIILGIIPLTTISIVFMLLAAACQSMEGPAYDALIADITRTEDRERAYSLQYLGANLGLVLSPTIAGFLFKNALWLAFIISGVAIGCSTLLIYFKVKDITPVKETSAISEYQTERSGVSLMTVLKENPVILLFVIAMALNSSAYRQFSYLMPLDRRADIRDRQQPQLSYRHRFHTACDHMVLTSSGDEKDSCRISSPDRRFCGLRVHARSHPVVLCCDPSLYLGRDIHDDR